VPYACFIFSASVGTDYSLWVLALRYEVKLGESSNIRYKTFNRISVNLKITTYIRQHSHNMNFMVAPCINNIKHIIVTLMHTYYKILR